MQLTSILLYQNLKEHFQIADYRLLSKNQPLARPFFLEADKGFKNNHIYLTDAILDLEVFRSIPEDAVLIICQREMKRPFFQMDVSPVCSYPAIPL